MMRRSLPRFVVGMTPKTIAMEYLPAPLNQWYYIGQQRLKTADRSLMAMSEPKFASVYQSGLSASGFVEIISLQVRRIPLMYMVHNRQEMDRSKWVVERRLAEMHQFGHKDGH